MLSKHGVAERAVSHSALRVGVLTSHLFGSSGHQFKPDPSLVTEGILTASHHLRGSKCLLKSTLLLMMSSLFKRAAHSTAAALQTPTSLVAVNIYPPAITAAPSSLEATACWVNRGWRWEINEQCASGSGCDELLMRRVAAQSDDMYLRKRSPRSLMDAQLPSACDSRVQTSCYHQHTGANHKRQQPVWSDLYQAALCCYLADGW